MLITSIFSYSQKLSSKSVGYIALHDGKPLLALQFHEKVFVDCSKLEVDLVLTSTYTHFNTLKKKALDKHCGSFRKTLWKRVKLLILNFTFFHIVYYAIYILRSSDNHISVVICSFFEFWDSLKMVY